MRSPLARLSNLDRRAHDVLDQLDVRQNLVADEITRTMNGARTACAAITVLCLVAATAVLYHLVNDAMGV